MLALKAKLKEAEKIKKDIIKKNVLSQEYIVKKEGDFIYFPVKEKIKGYTVVDIPMTRSRNADARDIKSLAKKFLSVEELEKLKTAHDIIGSIAILEIDEVLRKKEKKIADAVLKSNRNIKTVLRKDAGHEGEFRTQKMKWLAGIKTKKTVHKENNVFLKLDVEKVYFSPRLSTERKRISGLVKKGENVLVMFSGCAPYPCVLSKNTEAKEIMGIEINPEGHKYGVENAILNRLSNVILVNGDVKKDAPVLSRIGLRFDRILMPLPKDAEDFLGEALMLSKKGTVIHFYNFLHEEDFVKAEEMVSKACKKHARKWKKISFVKCGQHAPRVFRICLDFKVLN